MNGLAIAAATAAGLVGAAIVLLRRRLVLIDVDGSSMEPTLWAGDRVLVRRVSLGELRVGDVVVVEGFDAVVPRHRPTARRLAARRWIIKRVAALPGDPVPVAVARVQGVPAASPVPAGRLVLLGDNPDHSSDSRSHGYYRGRDVLGVVARPIRSRWEHEPR